MHKGNFRIRSSRIFSFSERYSGLDVFTNYLLVSRNIYFPWNTTKLHKVSTLIHFVKILITYVFENLNTRYKCEEFSGNELTFQV